MSGRLPYRQASGTIFRVNVVAEKIGRDYTDRLMGEGRSSPHHVTNKLQVNLIVRGKDSVRRKPDVLRGTIAGAIGGLVASAVMNQFQKLVSRLFKDDIRSHGAQSLQQGTPDIGV